MKAEECLDRMRALAADCATRADEADAKGRLPAEDIVALKESGYLGLNIPEKYGGSDLPMRMCIEAHMELAKGSGSTALTAGMTLQIFGTARDHLPWTEEKYEEFARAAVAGGLFNSCATEPELGSPSRGAFFKTRAERTDEGFVINGHKTWTTGGRFLTHLLVGLTLEDENAVVLVEGDREGVEWIENWGDGLSLRASDSFDMLLKDVHVPAQNLVKNAEKGEKKRPAWFPMMLASTYLGIAMASRDALIKYALQRVPTALGKPITTLPKIQREIGEIDMKLQAAKSLLLEVADSGADIARVPAAKQFAVTVANEVTDQALRVAGGMSLTRTLPLERYFRDVRAGTMQPPSGDTALEAVGRAAIDSLDSKDTS